MANEKNLTPFSKTYQPKNPGRKPSKLKKYIKDNGISSQDVTLIFRNIIMTKSVDEIKKMVFKGKDEKGADLPAIVWGFCMAWIADCKRGMSSGGVFSQIMDRSYGRPPQENINTNINADVDVKSMTKAEREELKKNILKQLIEKNKDTVEEIINARDDKGGKVQSKTEEEESGKTGKESEASDSEAEDQTESE